MSSNIEKAAREAATAALEAAKLTSRNIDALIAALPEAAEVVEQESLSAWLESANAAVAKLQALADAIALVSETPERDAAIRKMADEQYGRDGECEIDNDAIVSEGDDNGAFVAAWVWVDFCGTPFDKDPPDEERYENRYEHCGETWTTYADSGCNDECPVCGLGDIQPVESIDRREVAHGS
jgi:hypothetical protein